MKAVYETLSHVFAWKDLVKDGGGGGVSPFCSSHKESKKNPHVF